MSLDIGDALSEGLDRTVARNGLVLVGVFVVFGLVNAVVQQSYSRVQLEAFDLAEFLSEIEGLPIDQEQIQQLLDQAMQQATALAYLDGLSLGALFGLTVVLAFVAEAMRIVAIRVFVSEGTEGIPASLATRNIVYATINGVVGGIVAFVLIVLGLFLLVVPGIFLAVTFYFTRQEIAVEDKNFVDALRDSWALTTGSRFEVLALGAILLVLGIGVSLVADAFVAMGATASTVANVLLTSILAAYSVAAVSQAYTQLRREREEGDDLDPYLDDDLDGI